MIRDSSGYEILVLLPSRIYGARSAFRGGWVRWDAREAVLARGV
jgi:hypothetical protein